MAAVIEVTDAIVMVNSEILALNGNTFRSKNKG